MHILIVDDNAITRRTLRQMLAKLGYSAVDEARDGKEALQVLDKTRVDMIFTGWSMPGMSGPELTAHLRTMKQHADLPIFLFTSRNTTEDVLAAMESGITDYLLKPLTPELLASRIRIGLARAQASRERKRKNRTG